MIRRVQKITIIHSTKPSSIGINDELKWFGTTLGLFNLRDKDQSCFRIFIELLKAAKAKNAISSDELAYKLDLSRGTIVHHINKLMEAGLVVNEHNKYMLRVDNLNDLIKELELDIERAMKDLKGVAGKIDRYLGL